VSGPTGVVLAPYHRQASDALDAGDLDALVDLLAPGFVDHTSGDVGAELFRARVAALMAAFDGIRFVITHSVADGSLLAGRGHITGVHTGPFGGIPATGAAIDVETVDVVRLGEDGRVTERWGGLDRFALLTQLGVLPARP
jgi:predicted ester cyclase